jgi:hypothetical protein
MHFSAPGDREHTKKNMHYKNQRDWLSEKGKKRY